MVVITRGYTIIYSIKSHWIIIKSSWNIKETKWKIIETWQWIEDDISGLFSEPIGEWVLQSIEKSDE